MFFWGQLFEVESTFDKALFHRDGLPSNELSRQLLDQYLCSLQKVKRPEFLQSLVRG